MERLQVLLLPQLEIGFFYIGDWVFFYIKELATHFKNNIVWLNPELIRLEWVPWTRKVISSIIPMFNLTIEGIEEAMNYLRKSGKDMYTTVQILKGFNY